jgi:hypothetical protein
LGIKWAAFCGMGERWGFGFCDVGIKRFFNKWVNRIVTTIFGK